MIKRITPGNITHLEPNEIFVFGSNEAGIHGAGAAKTALKWGAKMHTGYGIMGKTFAIPTKSHSIETLPIDKIGEYVDRFISEAKDMQQTTFLVTEIGTGLAGYTPFDIAPLFKEAINVKNISLPKRFLDILNNL